MNIRTLAKKIPLVDYTYKCIQDLRISHGNSVIIDVCTVCKSNCVYCLHQYEKLAKPEMMDYNLFQIIIDILHREKYKNIYLYQSGEPMLNPWIYHMMYYASIYKMNITIGTRLNCVIDFPKLEVAADMASKLHFVITVDSIYKQPSFISSGIDNQLVLDNIRKISQLLKYPNVSFEFVSLVTSENENELDTVKYWLSPLGFDNWYPSSVGYYMWQQASQETLGVLKEYLPDNPQYRDRFDIINGVFINKFKSCASRIPVINVHGDVSICCHDMLHKTNTGNVIVKDSLRKIINGDEHQAMLTLSRHRKLDICRSCN
jgi:sulfatase maturation enzyme AslB (radical SAM superfamily)